MKKLFAIAVLVLVLVLVLQLVSFACDPPDPPDGATCSPGFWKNHKELWPDVGVCPDLLMDMLKARGPGSEALRIEAASLLNAASPVDYCADD
jgi:hypothetical protein